MNQLIQMVIALHLVFSFLECCSKSSKNLNDIYVINLELCSNVQVIKECNANYVEDPQKLSLDQVSNYVI